MHGVFRQMFPFSMSIIRVNTTIYVGDVWVVMD
ncbi:uncharacterized protein METZ01_LOCUS379011 [marine metagenome]|uniref:Uncharacterized protein n=1 Tax=marine metagenome TaxID=408172 RepID=A0A382TWY6_9ZZZZ